MSTETARRWRQNEVAKGLREIARLLRKASDIATSLADAQEAMQKADTKFKEVVRQAQDPVLGGIKKARTGIPAPLRRRADTLASRVEALAADVKATPITKDDKALAKHAREHRKENDESHPRHVQVRGQPVGNGGLRGKEMGGPRGRRQRPAD